MILLLVYFKDYIIQLRSLSVHSFSWLGLHGCNVTTIAKIRSGRNLDPRLEMAS